MRVMPILEESLQNPRLLIEKKSPALWPSEGGIFVERDGRRYRIGGCNRKAYYRLKDFPKDRIGRSVGSQLTLDLGHLIQDWLTNVIKGARVYLGDEVPIQIKRTTVNGNSYLISGSIDIIVQDPDTGRPIFCEIKSVGLWKAMAGLCQSSTAGKFAPTEDHVIQVMPYLDVARTEFGVQDPECHIIYICRDKPNLIGEHVVQIGANGQAVITNDIGVTSWDDVNLQALYADYDQQADMAARDQVPEMPFTTQYSDKDLVWLAEHGMLNQTETKVVKANLKNGSSPLLRKGDFACHQLYCDFFNTCHDTGIAAPDGVRLPRPVEEQPEADIGLV